MRTIAFTLLAVASLAPSFAQPPIKVQIVGPPANHQVQWTTRLGYLYRIEASPDLATWQDAGIEIPGTGGTVAHGFMSADDRWFYRIEESPDAQNSGFLQLPTPGQEVALEDGVGFAFDLDLTVFPQFPSKIRIYQRAYPSGAWELIGAVEDFLELREVRFAPGSVVWVPEEPGDYEVKATAVDANDQVIGNAIRLVSVIPNSPPAVVINSGPTTPAAEKQVASLTTTVTDPDGDEIRRLEFFDNGVLMGTDEKAPFGNEIRDRMGGVVGWLWKGTHSITAVAYDSKGAVGALSAPYEVTITDGNSQPQVTASASLFNGIVRIAFDASDPDGAADIASVTAENLGNGETASALYPERPFPWNEFTMSAVGWEPGLHTLAVMIRDQANTLGYLALAEVTIPGTPSSFAADLAADIADETTLTIANARFTGTEDSSGIFDFGLYRGLQLDQGVALTTGLFSSWNAGDLFDDTDKQWGLAGDEELFFRVAGATTHDAAVLEFDVFCVNGQLVIDYQFGTEEYDEYVERFNDAFMITVDGVPVSLLPDCSDIVGVQSVNLSENRHLFLGDDEDIDANEMVDPDFEDSKVEYDGMTLRLRANALVTPGQSHHVRIVIADVNDALLDAALFLGQGSFKTVQP